MGSRLSFVSLVHVQFAFLLLSLLTRSDFRAPFRCRSLQQTSSPASPVMSGLVPIINPLFQVMYGGSASPHQTVGVTFSQTPAVW